MHYYVLDTLEVLVRCEVLYYDHSDQSHLYDLMFFLNNTIQCYEYVFLNVARVVNPHKIMN